MARWGDPKVKKRDIAEVYREVNKTSGLSSFQQQSRTFEVITQRLGLPQESVTAPIERNPHVYFTPDLFDRRVVSIWGKVEALFISRESEK